MQTSLRRPRQSNPPYPLPGSSCRYSSADRMKVQVLEVVLERRLTFDKQDVVSAEAESCNYHARAIRHICRVISTELSQILALKVKR